MTHTWNPGKLRQLRADYRISRAALARALGMTESGIRNYEQGAVPSSEKLLDMADLLQVQPEELFDRD